MPVKILLYSDLHLESDGFQPKQEWLREADVVIQAGDLNTGWKKPTTWLKSLAMPVVYVPGNHEPWNDLTHVSYTRMAFQSSDPYGRPQPRGVTRWTHDLQGFEDRLDDALQGSQAVLLRENRVHVVERPEGHYRFIGSTLWTPLNLRFMEDYAAYNDFKRIRWAPGEPFTPAHRTALFHRHEAWLRRALAVPFDGKTIVVTHHAPSLQSWPTDPSLALADRAMHCNDLDDLVQQADLWVHGHVHHTFDYRFGRCRVVCNPRGHTREKQRAWFRKNWLIEL